MTVSEREGYWLKLQDLKKEWKRLKGVIAEVCDVCGQPLDSTAHKEHCRG